MLQQNIYYFKQESFTFILITKIKDVFLFFFSEPPEYRTTC